MQPSKFIFLIGLICLGHLNLKAQAENTSGDQKLIFEKIIYHSGQCNGICPEIDLEIDSNNNVLLKKSIWKEKGLIDNHKSGNFKGKIDPKTYFNLMANLIASDYSNLKFRPVFCCDGVITTIIIYANGKRVALSSMTPPEKALRLISFLHDLATQLNIPPTTEEIKMEELL